MALPPGATMAVTGTEDNTHHSSSKAGFSAIAPGAKCGWPGSNLDFA
jgi:hypothetical protein